MVKRSNLDTDNPLYPSNWRQRNVSEQNPVAKEIRRCPPQVQTRAGVAMALPGYLTGG